MCRLILLPSVSLSVDPLLVVLVFLALFVEGRKFNVRNSLARVLFQEVSSFILHPVHLKLSFSASNEPAERLLEASK